MIRGTHKQRIPNDDIEDVALLRNILRQAGVSEDEYLGA